MTLASARVRWGDSRFWRINEFAGIEGARDFAATLRVAHAGRPAFQIIVETRVQHDRWIVADE